METVRKYGGNLGQGGNRGDIMAEKIQRSYCSCIWELRFFLISHTIGMCVQLEGGVMVQRQGDVSS